MKHNYLNKILGLVCIITLFTLEANGQSSYNMTYSQFGVGQSNAPFNMPMANAMGGVIYTRQGSNFINPMNPASYAGVQTESFVFDMALMIQNNTLRTRDQHLSDFDGNLSYLTVAFPIFKWWKMSAGLMPYSEMSYSSVSTNILPVEGSVKTIYDGVGGINRVYWGNGFNIGDNLSLGFNVNYLYGYLERAITYDFVNSDVTHFVDSRKQKNTHLNAFTFDFGAQYRWQLDERRKVMLALTLQIPQTIQVEDTSWIYTLEESSGGSNQVIFPSNNDPSYQSHMKQPLKVGFGLSYEYDQRWLIAADFTYAQWNGMKYEEGLDKPVFSDDDCIDYRGNYRISIGGGWLGNKEATNYWGRIGISAGIYYDRASLSLLLADGSYRLDEIGAGMGFTFPMRKGRSQITLSLGYSSFGDINLLRNDCFTIGLSVGSCEKWFSKRKYN